MARLNFGSAFFSGCPYCASRIPYNHHACPNDPKNQHPSNPQWVPAKQQFNPGGQLPTTYYCAKCDAIYARKDMDPCYIRAREESDSSEPRLFTGTLQGYRHFALTSTGTIATRERDFRVSSPSQRYHPGWTGGENIAICDNYAGADEPNMMGWTPRMEIKRRIDELERKIAQKIIEYDEIEITSFSDPHPVYLSTSYRPATMAEIQGWGIELEQLQRWTQEYERYRANEHSMKNCTCGFYVGYHPTGDFYAGHIDRSIGKICLHAVVECYGKIVLGTKGFRAQKLRIVAMAPYRREIATRLPPFRSDMFGYFDQPVNIQAQVYHALPAPIPDMAYAVKRQLPNVRWFDVHEEMLAAYPEPDRTGLVQHNHTDYGMGNGN